MKTIIFLVIGFLLVIPIMAVMLCSSIAMIVLGGYLIFAFWGVKKQKKKKNLILFPVVR